MEEDDLFLALQLQEAENFQHYHLPKPKFVPTDRKYEKVSSSSEYECLIERYYQSSSRTDDLADYDAYGYDLEKNSKSGSTKSIWQKEHQKTVLPKISNTMDQYPSLVPDLTPSKRVTKTRWQKEKEAALQAQAATDLIQPREGIDLETAQLLTRMIAMKSCYDINSLIKQNKEAFYFYGQETEAQNCLIKVFKTTARELRKREVYIHGEWRFRYQQNHLNPKKMVKLWCQKEFRNLKRLQRANIPCQEPKAMK